MTSPSALTFLMLVLSSCLVGGCGGKTDALPNGQAPAAQQRVALKLKGASLIYASGGNATYFLSYKDGSVLGSVDEASGFAESCSNAKGDVFLPALGTIWEYRHGGSMPVTKLTNSYYPGQCSVDPTTGDLAVANLSAAPDGGPGNVAVFRNASGTPTYYSISGVAMYSACAFDSSGNLFIGANDARSRYVLAKLPKGSGSIQTLTLSKKVEGDGIIQWDGEHLAIGADGAHLIYQVSVSGSDATVVGVTKLHASRTPSGEDFWIQGGVILASAGPHSGSVGVWDYPRGGKLRALYHVLRKGLLGGVTVSVAPK